MVRQVQLAVEVPGFTTQGLFDAVYGAQGANFLRSFHKELNNDPDASVGDWVDDARTVRFTTPVDAPAFIKRLIGKDVMQVTEEQRRAFHPDGSITLTSLPQPDMPGGAKFSTQAVFTFRNLPGGGGCKVSAEVTCSAAGPYGLTGTIEAFMADAAKKSLQDFLDFMLAYARQLQAPAAVPLAAPAAAAAAQPAAAAAAATAAAAAPQPAAAAPSQAAEAAAAETFYDAEELPLPWPLPPASAAAAAHGRLPAVVPSGDGLRFEDAAILYLRYMCRTGDQTVGLLQAMELQVRSLQEKVAQLQAAAEQRQQHRRWLPELPDTVSTRQALLGAALLATSTAAATLMWSRRHYPQHG